jgi:chemotaxis protein CheY-P-specific phosphatase CheC
MKLEDGTRSELFKLIEAGVFGSAERLAKMSGTTWQMQSVSVKMGSTEKPVYAKEDGDQLGSYFSMQGGFFLVIFSQKSGAKVADVFLKRSTKPSESVLERQQMALAEISNVMVNAVVTALADACDTVLFISAPESMAGTRDSLVKQAIEKAKNSNSGFVISTSVHMSSPALASDCTVIFLIDSRLMQRLVNALES